MTRIREETQIELGKRELLSLCAGPPQILSCLRGELWVTFDGRKDDLVLGAGERIELDGRPGVVLSGLQPSTLSLTSTVGCRLEPERSQAAALALSQAGELSGEAIALAARVPTSQLPLRNFD